MGIVGFANSTIGRFTGLAANDSSPMCPLFRFPYPRRKMSH
jgi:hypothetical protein